MQNVSLISQFILEIKPTHHLLHFEHAWQNPFKMIEIICWFYRCLTNYKNLSSYLNLFVTYGNYLANVKRCFDFAHVFYIRHTPLSILESLLMHSDWSRGFWAISQKLETTTTWVDWIKWVHLWMTYRMQKINLISQHITGNKLTHHFPSLWACPLPHPFKTTKYVYYFYKCLTTYQNFSSYLNFLVRYCTLKNLVLWLV